MGKLIFKAVMRNRTAFTAIWKDRKRMSIFTAVGTRFPRCKAYLYAAVGNQPARAVSVQKFEHAEICERMVNAPAKRPEQKEFVESPFQAFLYGEYRVGIVLMYGKRNQRKLCLGFFGGIEIAYN